MGRRDEPELEELSKLLRRLETMDVGSKPESARKFEPEPPSEYVGALRGAAHGKATHNQRETSLSGAGMTTRAGQQKAGSSSTNAMIIGAATAAVVSSLVAATVVLWTSGGNRSEDAGRLTFYATKRPDAGASSPASFPDTNSRPSPEDAQRLLQRADTYLRSGKPADARVVLEQAARAGSGVAALTLGAMYDPGRVAQFANLGIAADPTVARVWYERAKDLGVAEANDRLAELAAR